MKEISEEQLIRMLNRGSEKAFESLFRCYYRPLTLYAAKYVDDIEEAKEITQEFFVRLWSRQPTFQSGGLKTYLYRGIRNACLNYIEASKVADRHMKDYEEPLYTYENALKNLVLAEQEEQLMRAIDGLPSRCREIFLMSRMEQLSYQSIADQLNLSVKTVESQMSIALRRLRDVLLCLAGLLLMMG